MSRGGDARENVLGEVDGWGSGAGGLGGVWVCYRQQESRALWTRPMEWDATML